MTIREAGKGMVTTVGGTYRIGFINMDGQEDETELDAYNMTELEELYRDFCKENGFRQNTVTYMERKMKRRHRETGACLDREN